MKKLILVLLLVSLVFGAQTIEPFKKLQTDGLVSDMLYKNDTLYVATANGVIQQFDKQTRKQLMKIELPQIKSFDFSMVPAKVYSIDLFEKMLLITSQGQGSYRNIWIYKDNSLQKIIGTKSGYMVVMAEFLSKEKILFATLSNQLFIYDLKTAQVVRQNQLSYSSFSDFDQNSEKTELASTDESGVVHLVDSTTLNIKKELKGQNVDRIYDVEYKNGIVLGAGQDRRLSVYKPFQNYYLQFDFLLYACALSEDGKYGAVAYNTANDVGIFNLNTKTKLYDLVKNKAVVTKILFIDKDEVIIGSESQTVNFYKF